MRENLKEDLIWEFVKEAARRDSTIDRFQLEGALQKLPLFENIYQRLIEELKVEYDGEGHFYAYDDEHSPKVYVYGDNEKDAEKNFKKTMKKRYKREDEVSREFANLWEEDTGLTRKICITSKEGTIGPHIKVFKEHPGSPAVYLEIPSIEREPRKILDETQGLINKRELDKAKKWILLNRENLLEFWERGNELFIDEVTHFVNQLTLFKEDNAGGSYSYTDGLAGGTSDKELDFDVNHLNDLEPFDSQQQYAEDHLEKIGEGSARIVYAIDESKVLKLAKNEKGIAQNRMEANQELQSKYPFAAKTHEVDDSNYFWITEDRAEHIDEESFKELSGMKFKDFADVLKYEWSKVKGKTKEKPSAYTEILKNQFFHSLMSMLLKYDMPYLDYAKLKHYGKIGNELVLTDYGLTREIWRKYYKDSDESS